MNSGDQEATKKLKESADEITSWLAGKIPEEALIAAAKLRQAESQPREDSKPSYSKEPAESGPTAMEWSALSESDKGPSESSSVDWFYICNDATIGPVSEANMHQLIQAKALSFSSLVWHSGLSTWVTLESTSLRYAKVLTASPPPISLTAVSPTPSKTKAAKIVPMIPNTSNQSLSKDTKNSIYVRYKTWWNILFVSGVVYSLSTNQYILSDAPLYLTLSSLMGSVLGLFGFSFIVTGLIWLCSLCKLRDRAYMIVFTVLFYLIAIMGFLGNLLVQHK